MKPYLARASTAALIAPILALAVGAPAAAERLSDRDLKALLQEIRRDVNALHKAIEPQYRTAVIRNERGEFKVSEGLDALEKSAGEMASSVGGRNDANVEVTDFLGRAAAIQRRAEEGRWMLGAEEEWASLQPRLERLAMAYGGDFAADPSTWKLERLTDQQVADLADSVADSAKKLRSPLNAALKKDKSIPPGDRDSVLDELAGLSDAAKALGSNAKKGLDASAEVSRLARHAEALAGFIDEHGTAMAAVSSTWGAVEGTLDTLQRAFEM